jgi:hypothetical protein
MRQKGGIFLHHGDQKIRHLELIVSRFNTRVKKNAGLECDSRARPRMSCLGTAKPWRLVACRSR